MVFHFNSGFAWGGGNTALAEDLVNANHGPQMPVTFGKLSDNLAFYGMVGPKVCHLPRFWPHLDVMDGYVHITDLLPTACVAAGLPFPGNATGCVRQDFLHDVGL